MNIKIDGKPIKVTDVTKNIVEIAEENGIKILAPCFRAEKKYGCCNACVIEINGEQKYACGTQPADGMEIVYNRPDLDIKRKERLAKYAENLKSNKNNTCSEENSTNSCSCSCGSNCGRGC